jgi:hypothetical protein
MTLTHRIRLHRIRQQAYQPQPFTRLEWAILVAQAAAAAATIWFAFVVLLSFAR